MMWKADRSRRHSWSLMTSIYRLVVPLRNIMSSSTTHILLGFLPDIGFQF